MNLYYEIMIMLMSSVKFLLAIPLAAYQYEFTICEIFIFSSIGGVLWIIIFAKFSNWIIDQYNTWMSSKQKANSKKRLKKVVAVKIVRKYGFWHCLFNPYFFFHSNRYFYCTTFFPNKKKTLPVLAASVFGWSFILSVVLTNL